MSYDLGNLDSLTDEEFVEGWRAITGEPPSAMLDDRTQMIRLILDGSPELPLRPSILDRD